LIEIFFPLKENILLQFILSVWNYVHPAVETLPKCRYFTSPIEFRQDA